MKKAILPSILILFLCFIYLQLNPKQNSLNEKEIQYQAEIKGEILNPGIYDIKKDETLEDLIDKAGGLTHKADTSALSLQKDIVHEDVIVIPEIESVEKISLNTASQKELMTLPGIGESKANKIIVSHKGKISRISGKKCRISILHFLVFFVYFFKCNIFYSNFLVF